MDEIGTGVEFNFSYAPGISEEQIIGVELAGEMWSNYLGDTHQNIDNHDVLHIDNTVINIHVEIGSDSLPDNVIGGAFPAISDKYKYEDIYDALIKDATTDNDQLAIDSLLDGNKANVLVNGDIVENDKFKITTANLKALNIIDSDSGEGQKLDGYIVMSDLSNFSTVEWNYNYLGGAQPGTLDFLTTITHEIGHTLGFISGADRVTSAAEILNYYMNSASVNIVEEALSIQNYGGYFAQIDNFDRDDKSSSTAVADELQEFDEEHSEKDVQKFNDALEVLQNVDITTDPKLVEDSFEQIKKFLKQDDDWKDFLKEDSYFKDTVENLNSKEINSQELAERMTSLDLFRYSAESSDQGANQLTRGASSYFSLDGSDTGLAMSNGQDFQGSHWQDREMSNGLGIMNPTVALNERWEISANDLMAMDAIGWDVNYSQPLDLPALYAQASAAADSAWIGNRDKDVNKIIDGDAYERRRSRTVSYAVTADGYFSTFSEPTSPAESSSSEVVANIDNWTVVIDRHGQTSISVDSDVLETNEPSVSLENIVQKVDAVMLTMKDFGRGNSLLDEITGSLTTGLEAAIAF